MCSPNRTSRNGCRYGPARRSVTDSSWLQHLNLVLAVEQEFGIQFEPEEMIQMETVGSIAELVQSNAG
jgi:hypothetical protein